MDKFDGGVDEMRTYEPLANTFNKSSKRAKLLPPPPPPPTHTLPPPPPPAARAQPPDRLNSQWKMRMYKRYPCKYGYYCTIVTNGEPSSHCPAVHVECGERAGMAWPFAKPTN